MKNRILTSAFALATLLAASAPLYAADTFDRITSAKLAEILKASGAQDVKTHPPSDGFEFVTFNDGTGPVSFGLTSCDKAGCEVVQMSITYDKGDGEPHSLATVNSFNATNLHAQAALLPAGELSFMKLFVTNGGVTEANLMANAVIFLQAPEVFAAHVATQNITAVDPAPGGVMPASSTPAKGVQAGISLQAPRLKNLDILKRLPSNAKRPARKFP